jgi:predicted DNA-binding transcriptional regulator YafY
LDALPEFFGWLEGARIPEVPESYAAPSETILRERTLRMPIRTALQSHIEVIRFAAANRLCVDLDYRDSTRRIEPYSLRRTQDDNIILHAWSVDKDQHRSYRVDRIQGARSTNEVFVPRYAIELTPSGVFAKLLAEREGFEHSVLS